MRVSVCERELCLWNGIFSASDLFQLSQLVCRLGHSWDLHCCVLWEWLKTSTHIVFPLWSLEMVFWWVAQMLPQNRKVSCFDGNTDILWYYLQKKCIQIVQNIIWKLAEENDAAFVSSFSDVLILVVYHEASTMGTGQLIDTWAGIWIGFSLMHFKKHSKGYFEPLCCHEPAGCSLWTPLQAKRNSCLWEYWTEIRMNKISISSFYSLCFKTCTELIVMISWLKIKILWWACTLCWGCGY